MSIKNLLVTLVLLLCTIVVIQAQGLPPDSIHLDAPDTFEVNQTFVVEVTANVDTASYGFGYQMVYDPAYLRPVNRPDVFSNDITSEAPATVGDIFRNAQRGISKITQRTDGLAEVDVAYTLLAPAEPVTGQGVLSSVAFEVLQSGDTTIELQRPRIITIENNQRAVDVSLNLGQPTIWFSLTDEGGRTTVSTPPRRPSLFSQQFLLISLSLTIVFGVVALFILFFFWKRQNERHKRQVIRS